MGYRSAGDTSWGLHHSENVPEQAADALCWLDASSLTVHGQARPFGSPIGLWLACMTGRRELAVGRGQRRSAARGAKGAAISHLQQKPCPPYVPAATTACPGARIWRTTRLVEDHGLVAVHEDSVLQMPAHGSRQHNFLEVSPFAHEILHRVSV